MRLNRKRFWGKEMDADKLAAYQTLYSCLTTVAMLIAPIAPFYADRLYTDLTRSDRSVHLAILPEPDDSVIDKDLERRMALAQRITSMVLSLRRKAEIKVRQPLQRIMIPAGDEALMADLRSITPLVLGEVNVKELETVAADAGVLVKKVKPDFKKLGPKFGKSMKKVAAAIQNLTQPQIAGLERDGNIDLDLDGEKVTVELADVDVISEDIPGWLVANEGNITVALDITVTPELRREGIAREIVNRIQNIRKDRGYNITDKISLVFAPVAETEEAIREYASYISRQVLAETLTVEPVTDGSDGVEILDIDGVNLPVAIALC